MKFVLLILPIVMMVQTSMAASLFRVKREADLHEALKVVVDIYERTVPLTEAATQAALGKMPKTSAYDSYRDELESYMEALNEFKSKKGPCVDKTFDLITKFDGIVEPYEEESAPAEAKHVFELISADNRFDAVEKEMEEWTEKYGITDMDAAFENVEPAVALKILPMFMKVC